MWKHGMRLIKNRDSCTLPEWFIDLEFECIHLENILHVKNRAFIHSVDGWMLDQWNVYVCVCVCVYIVTVQHNHPPPVFNALFNDSHLLRLCVEHCWNDTAQKTEVLGERCAQVLSYPLQASCPLLQPTLLISKYTWLCIFQISLLYITSSQSFIFGFIHSFWNYHCVVCTTCEASHTRRYEFSNKTNYHTAVCVIVKLAMLKGQPTFMISLKLDKYLQDLRFSQPTEYKGTTVECTDMLMPHKWILQAL
jgi:hypothetical protein